MLFAGFFHAFLLRAPMVGWFEPSVSFLNELIIRGAQISVSSPFAAELQPSSPLWGNDPKDVSQARQAGATALANEDEALRLGGPQRVLDCRAAHARQGGDGVDRHDAAVGSPPAGITFSEWALSNPAAWAYLAPILIENNGWALFITTARGRNHAKSMLDMAQTRKDWFSEVLPVNVTGAMSEEAVEQQRVEYTGIFGQEAADALIDQEYYCSFEAAILGAYWGKELILAEQQGRICDVPVNTDLPVHTAWDIGVDDAMAIWCFQVYPDHLDVVDYYEGHGQGFDHYCAWLDERGYHGTDWMPHDAKVREVGAPGARTRIETLFTLGRKPELAPEQSLMDGINAARKTIPFARFDAKRCAQGLESLRSYRTEWDEKTRAFKKTPEHNWASHGADGWRCLSLSWRAPMREPEPEKAPIGLPLPDMTMDQFMDIEDSWSTREERV